MLLWPRAAEPREFCGLSMRVTSDHLRGSGQSEFRYLIKWHAAAEWGVGGIGGGGGGGRPARARTRECCFLLVHHAGQLSDL